MQEIETVRTMLVRNLQSGGDRPAIIEGGRRLTFRELADRTRRMGNALLNLGLGKGDRVAIMSRNSLENAESYFSIPNAGLVLVMVNFRLAPVNILEILRDSQARVVIVTEKYAGQLKHIQAVLPCIKHIVYIGDEIAAPEGWLHYETLIAKASAAEPEVQIDADDLAALMYTSGTTGEPKGCMATHRNFYHVGRSMAHELQMQEGDVGIVPVAMFHVSGIVILLGGIHSGTASVIMPRWDTEEFMALVEQHRVTLGLLATPMLRFFVDHPNSGEYDLSSLRKLMFAGAPVSSVVFRKAIDQFGNIFIHAFGTTETMGAATILRTEEVAQALAEGRTEILESCGKTYCAMETEVVDEHDQPVPPDAIGEVRIRGTGMTRGYWNRETETQEVFRNGWYYSGDLGTVDAYGYIQINGRKTEMIITGGENVFPAEVENVLYQHPAVAEVAVIGIQDQKWGEAVTAFVVKKPGAQVNEEELKAFCSKVLARYKVPRKILWVENLPVSTSGKLLKNKLKLQYVRRQFQQARSYFAKRSFVVPDDE